MFSLPTALESSFAITYSSELDILGVSLGLYLLLLTTLIILSIIWTLQHNYARITIGIIVGAFLLTFELLVFMKTGNIQAIMIDSI